MNSIKNEIYTDLEKPRKIAVPDKAKNYIKFLETDSFYTDDIDANEVVMITTAIKVAQLAELEALEWAKSAKTVEIDYRIKELKLIL